MAFGVRARRHLRQQHLTTRFRQRRAELVRCAQVNARTPRMRGHQQQASWRELLSRMQLKVRRALESRLLLPLG